MTLEYGPGKQNNAKRHERCFQCILLRLHKHGVQASGIALNPEWFAQLLPSDLGLYDIEDKDLRRYIRRIITKLGEEEHGGRIHVSLAQILILTAVYDQVPDASGLMRLVYSDPRTENVNTIGFQIKYDNRLATFELLELVD